MWPSVFKLSVCESQFDLINIFCWYETKNVSGIYRTIHNENRWSRIRTISKHGQFSCPWFRAPDTFFPRKMYFSATGRCCSNHYLSRKIEISMLYFSPNSMLTLHRINVFKKAKTSTSYLSPSWHATCAVASNLRSPEFGCIMYAEAEYSISILCFSLTR